MSKALLPESIVASRSVGSRLFQVCADAYVALPEYLQRCVSAVFADENRSCFEAFAFVRRGALAKVASRLISEPFLALHPRIRAVARAMKSWLNGDAGAPVVEPDSHPEVQK